MNDFELRNKLESVLFSLGRRLSLDELSKLCKEKDHDKLKTTLDNLKKELDNKQTSLMLVDEGHYYKLTVREKYLPIIRKVVKKTELRKSILETLSIIALKAPVLQSDVIKIRTNKAYDHLRHLEENGYISREKKGRTKLIKLTQKFYDYFDIEPNKLKEKMEKKMDQLDVYQQDETIQKAEEPIQSPVKPYSEKMGDLPVYNVEEKKAEEPKGAEEEPEEAPETQEEKPAEEFVEPEEKKSEEVTEEAPSEKPQEEPQEQPKEESVTEEPKEDTESQSADQPEEAPEIQEVAEESIEPVDQEKEEEESPEESVEPEEKKSDEEPSEKKEKSQGLFPGGMPKEIQERVDKRVEELIKGEPKEE